MGINILRGLKAFGEASRLLAEPPERQMKQEYGEDDGAVEQRRVRPCRSIGLCQDRAGRAGLEKSVVAVMADLDYINCVVRGGVPVRGKLFQLLAVLKLILSVNSCPASGPSGSRDGTDD